MSIYKMREGDSRLSSVWWNDHEGEVPPHTIPFFLLLSSQSYVPGPINVQDGKCMIYKLLVSVVKATMCLDAAQPSTETILGSLPMTAEVALSAIQPSSSRTIELLMLQQCSRKHLLLEITAPDCESATLTSNAKKSREIIDVPSREKHAHDASSSKQCISDPVETSHT